MNGKSAAGLLERSSPMPPPQPCQCGFRNNEGIHTAIPADGVFLALLSILRQASHFRHRHGRQGVIRDSATTPWKTYGSVDKSAQGPFHDSHLSERGSFTPLARGASAETASSSIGTNPASQWCRPSADRSAGKRRQSGSSHAPHRGKRSPAISSCSCAAPPSQACCSRSCGLRCQSRAGGGNFRTGGVACSCTLECSAVAPGAHRSQCCGARFCIFGAILRTGAV